MNEDENKPETQEVGTEIVDEETAQPVLAEGEAQAEEDKEDAAEEDEGGLGCLGCLGILLVLGWAGWWLWTGPVSEWLSEKGAEGAVEAYEAGSYEEAKAKLEEQLAEAPDAPETLRAIGNLLRGSETFEAFLAMKRLKERDEATREDLRLFASLAQDVRKTHLAREVTKELLRIEPKNPDNLFLEARELFLAFRGAEALAKAEAILKRRPTHRPTRLLRARLLTLLPVLVTRLRGKVELKELADEEQDRVSLNALVLIAGAGMKPLGGEERNATLLRIENHPLATLGQRLRAYGLRVGPRRLDDAEMRVVLEQYGDFPDLLGPWLAGRGRFDEAMGLFSLGKAKERPELFETWFLVLLYPSELDKHKRLRRAEKLLVEARGHVSTARRSLHQAGMALRKGDSEAAKTEIEKAFPEANALEGEERNDALDEVAGFSLAVGLPALALKVLRERFAEGVGEDAPYTVCERYFAAAIMNKETEEGLAIAKQVEQRFPAQFAARNNHAYLKLLVGRNLEETAREVEELAKEGPPLPAFQTTLAFARLRTGKPKEALAAITDGGSAPIYRDDVDKVVCAAIMRANGKDEAAKNLVEAVNVERLLPEEAALLTE